MVLHSEDAKAAIIHQLYLKLEAKDQRCGLRLDARLDFRFRLLTLLGSVDGSSGSSSRVSPHHLPYHPVQPMFISFVR